MSSPDSDGGGEPDRIPRPSDNDASKQQHEISAPKGMAGIPPVSPPPPKKSAWDHKYLKWLPIPDMQRILPCENIDLPKTKDPMQDLKEIGSSCFWVGSMFGLGTLFGQMRSGHGARAILSRVCQGAGIGAVGIVGGSIIRDLALNVVMEQITMCESLRDAKTRQVLRKEDHQTEIDKVSDNPVDENTKPNPKEDSVPDRLEEHETVSEITTWILGAAQVVLCCVWLKAASASTRFLAAGIYPYFLGRWMANGNLQVSYSFAAYMMRRSRDLYLWYAWPLFYMVMDNHKRNVLSGREVDKTCRWIIYLLGVMLIWRYNRAARRYLSLDRKHYTVKSSAQYFLDSTRK